MVGFFLPHAIVAATLSGYLLTVPWAFALPTWTFLAGIVMDQLFETRSAVPHAGRAGWRLVLWMWHVLRDAATGNFAEAGRQPINDTP